MPRLSLPLLCFGIILVQLDEGRFITKARPKKYDCSEIEKYSRENALQTSGKSVEGEVANWWKGQMPLCSRTQWSFESLADQNSEFLCWRFQFCAQLTPSNEKYWQKGTRKFYSQAIWPSFSRPSTQEGRGTWLLSDQPLLSQREGPQKGKRFYLGLSPKQRTPPPHPPPFIFNFKFPEKIPPSPTFL